MTWKKWGFKMELTRQEEWAEQEAKFCDKMVDTYLDNAKHWIKGEPSLYTEKSYGMAAECVIRANCWKQMADNLRAPHRMRTEEVGF